MLNKLKSIIVCQSYLAYTPLRTEHDRYVLINNLARTQRDNELFPCVEKMGKVMPGVLILRLIDQTPHGLCMKPIHAAALWDFLDDQETMVQNLTISCDDDVMFAKSIALAICDSLNCKRGIIRHDGKKTTAKTLVSNKQAYKLIKQAHRLFP